MARFFLSDMFHSHKESYGAITVARSALSAVLPRKNDATFGKDANPGHMLRGIFKLRPTF